jgi:hypothetical protein
MQRLTHPKHQTPSDEAAYHGQDEGNEYRDTMSYALAWESLRLAKHLVLVRGFRQRELEVDVGAGQALVHLGVGVQTVVDRAALLLVENDADDTAAVSALEHAATDNLNRIDEIGQDGVVDGLEGARTRALLGLVGARPVGALRARQNATHAEDQDMAIGELLLELAGEALGKVRFLSSLD